jgi:hypothetical protein
LALSCSKKAALVEQNSAAKSPQELEAQIVVRPDLKCLQVCFRELEWRIPRYYLPYRSARRCWYIAL